MQRSQTPIRKLRRRWLALPFALWRSDKRHSGRRRLASAKSTAEPIKGPPRMTLLPGIGVLLCHPAIKANAPRSHCHSLWTPRITRLPDWSCPSTLGLDQLTAVVILYLRLPTAYIPLQSRTADTSVISWPTHLGLLLQDAPAATPGPMLLLSTAWTEMGDQTHLRLRPVHERQALGLPRFALVPPWTGSRLLPRLRTRFGAPQYLFFSLDISSNLPLSCTLGFSLRLSEPPHCDLTICLYLMSAHCSLALTQPLHYSPCTAPTSNTVKAFVIPLRSP